MSPRSIAAPPNPSAHRGKRLAAARQLEAEATEAADPVVAAPTAHRPPRPVQAQPTHRYRVGERLHMGNGGYSAARAASFCKVIALLPYEGHGTLLYRIRSDAEAFERVVAEADLSRSV